MQWRSGEAAGLPACKQQAECQSRTLKFSLILLKEGMGGIRKEGKAFPLKEAGSEELQKTEQTVTLGSLKSFEGLSHTTHHWMESSKLETRVCVYLHRTAAHAP